MRSKNFNNKYLSKKKATLAKEMKCQKMNYFGETLRELRLEKQLTQVQSANILGVTQAMWSAYEVGKSRPDLDIIILIARKFRISPFALLNRSLDKSKYFDPIYDMSFKEYERLEEGVIKKYKQRKLKKRIEDFAKL